MPGRDTGTGSVLEEMILPSLERARYHCRRGVTVGSRLGVGRHMVDVVAERDGARYIVSLKWQQVSGTAEQKVPFEIMCLNEILESGDYTGAYLVLGGDAWRFRDFFTSNRLRDHMRVSERITVMSLESFVAKVNREGL